MLEYMMIQSTVSLHPSRRYKRLTSYRTTVM